jgi:integrase
MAKGENVPTNKGRKRKPPHLVDRDGVYYVCFYDEEKGRSGRQSFGTSNLEKAEEIFAGWLDARKKSQRAQIISDVQGCFELYMNQHVLLNKSAKSQESIDVNRRALESFFGDMNIQDIERSHIYEYIDARKAGKIGSTNKKIKDGTIRRELTILQAVINFMVFSVEPRSLRIPSNEVITRLPKPPDSPAKERVLSEAELNKLRQECDMKSNKQARTHLFVWLLMETGARAGAIKNLTWDQVDLERQIIKLLPNDGVQNNKRRPTIPMSQALHDVLVKAKENATTRYVLGHTGATKDALKRILHKLDIRNASAHTFRHTFATRLVKNGAALADVSALTGDSIATLEKKYIHLSPTYLRKAIGLLSNGLTEVRAGA